MLVASGYFGEQRRKADADFAKPENEILSPWRVAWNVAGVALFAIGLVFALFDDRVFAATFAAFFLVWKCHSLRRALRTRRIHKARAAERPA